MISMISLNVNYNFPGIWASKMNLQPLFGQRELNVVAFYGFPNHQNIYIYIYNQDEWIARIHLVFLGFPTFDRFYVKDDVIS